MLRWNKQMHQYESDASLEKTIEEFDGYIGYVYPSNESSYYLCSVVIVSYRMCNVLVADFTEKVKFAKNCALENIQCLNHLVKILQSQMH